MVRRRAKTGGPPRPDVGRSPAHRGRGGEIIYTSHTIEHIKESAVAKLFREAHRALEPGGLLRVTTGPDAETDYRALQRSDRDWFYWARAYEKPGTYEHIYTLPATRASLAELWVHHVASALCAIDKSPNPRKMGEAEIRAALDEKGFPAVLDYFCGSCRSTRNGRATT
jgi:hypothetical protein